jgi:hypothetical protein
MSNTEEIIAGFSIPGSVPWLCRWMEQIHRAVGR